MNDTIVGKRQRDEINKDAVEIHNYLNKDLISEIKPLENND